MVLKQKGRCLSGRANVLEAHLLSVGRPPSYLAVGRGIEFDPAKSVDHGCAYRGAVQGGYCRVWFGLPAGTNGVWDAPDG